MLCQKGPDLSDVVQCKPARSSSLCNVLFEGQLAIEDYTKISDRSWWGNCWWTPVMSGIPVISSDERVDRRIWWLTVSKAADRSSRMRTDDLESAFAIRRASVTESSAVSVEWPLLKPDCLASSLLFCERNNETWLKTTRSSVLAMNGRRETGL